MRVVLDVNVLVSAVISGHGSPAKILDLWERGNFDLLISSIILEELERVIHYPKIQESYRLSDELVERFLALISGQAISVSPSENITIVNKDPSENRYLECAVAGNAAYIVTGDRHLLDLKEYRGVVILQPVGFLALLELEAKDKGGLSDFN